MPILRVRTHTVHFRVSEQEFEALKDACQTAGARSVSDFARAAVRRLMREHGEAASPATNSLQNIEQKLETVESTLRELAVAVGGSPGSGPQRIPS